MAMKGSYAWWRANYATDPSYAAVAAVLTPLGIDCKEVEVDHFPPNAAYSGTKYDQSLKETKRPAFPLPKYLHRYHRGDGGMGYHASTTGRTFVQSGWTGELKGHMSVGNFYAAMRQDIIDKQNVAYCVCEDRHLFDVLMRPAVDLALFHGLISSLEAHQIYVDQFGETP